MKPFYPAFDHLYVDGYRAALQDVLEVFGYIQDDMKWHKRKQNYKSYKAIVECMLENRTVLRENPDAFVRCTSDGGYEVYVSGHGNYWMPPTITGGNMKLTEDFKRFCRAQTRLRGNCIGCPLVKEKKGGDIACYPNSKEAKEVVAQWKEKV